MLLDILFTIVAVWCGYSELILRFFGSSLEKVHILYLLILWIGMIFAIYLGGIILIKTATKITKFYSTK
jgi:hypothetical protein